MTSTTSSPGSHPAPACVSYTPVGSAFGEVRVIWHHTSDGPKVHYVRLPNEEAPPRGISWGVFHAAVPRTCVEIAELSELVRRFLDGEPVAFDLSRIALDRCTEFQQKVLLADYGIPRGSASTYGWIANFVGRPGAAQAVGQALAHNPFPLIIPCHRAVRSDGYLGGYRGGLGMKRALLQLEGVEVTPAGRVVVQSYYY